VGLSLSRAEGISAAVESTGAEIGWSPAEDGYIASVCKEKEIQEWRNELRSVVPGRTRREILKRLRDLGILMQKRQIVKSEGDDLGTRMRVYVWNWAGELCDGAGKDGAEARTPVREYQRGAEEVAACEASLGEPEFSVIG
jgi:hypothetical protein